MEIAIFMVSLLTLGINIALSTFVVLTYKKGVTQPLKEVDDSDPLMEDELPPDLSLTQEQVAAKDIQVKAEIDRMNVLFGNPDIPYTGIDDEFENF